MRPAGARSIPGCLMWLGALLLNATLVLGVKFELEAETYPRSSELIAHHHRRLPRTLTSQNGTPPPLPLLQL